MGLGDIRIIQDLVARGMEGNTGPTWVMVRHALAVIGPDLKDWLSTLAQGRELTLTVVGEILKGLSTHVDFVTFLDAIEPRKAGDTAKPLELRQILHQVQACYGWPDSYLLNDPWSDRDYLPYHRWVEVVQTVFESRADEERNAWQRFAFIGWHHYYFIPRGEDSPPAMGFQEYLSAFGLNDIPTETDEEVLERAADFMAMFGVDLLGKKEATV